MHELHQIKDQEEPVCPGVGVRSPIVWLFNPGYWVGIDDYNYNNANTDFFTIPGLLTSVTGSVTSRGFYPTYANTQTATSPGTLTPQPPMLPTLGYDKPLLVGETGAKNNSSPTNTDVQASILGAATTEIPYYLGQIKSFNYFDASTANNWLLDGSATTGGGLSAFVTMGGTAGFQSTCTYSGTTLTCD